MGYFLNCLGIINPLGKTSTEVAYNLFQPSLLGMQERMDLIKGQSVIVGEVSSSLPLISEEFERFNSRNNRMMLAALMQIEAQIKKAIKRYGKDRVAVVLGSSTTGISDNEDQIMLKSKLGSFGESFEYEKQEPSSISEFVRAYYGLDGIALTISTACTSSVKALSTARRYLATGLCDAVIVGGADTLCQLTLNGFKALEALSNGLCHPLSETRDGINIGEGAAAFLLTREMVGAELLGIGETSDAYHVSAPDPEGTGAANAMSFALKDADIKVKDICYINVHGTGTHLNDAMEVKAIRSVFSENIPYVSSTKQLTGHMLGAAGINEIAFLYLAFQHNKLPQHYCGENFAEMAKDIRLVSSKAEASSNYMMSNSFAFGGNNVSVILGRGSL
ncbi:beta-ketoacyl-ACP synthase [Curvivirga aplysinae]|uniref:beta-ketoacyl-ACP synthase n=1 Tax=Curvivirga aplysinae TaxID=2529852 RepID=UPI0012BD4934|nr:beta-ketoacyl-ACP synthase [Curvivirga aplysinae]MTI11023.1 beta-ketoacyl-ACP synthase [Curvivirga aplysinae]